MAWQNYIAIGIAILAALWAGKMLLMPFVHSLRARKDGSCSGGCGCGHVEKPCDTESAKEVKDPISRLKRN